MINEILDTLPDLTTDELEDVYKTAKHLYDERLINDEAEMVSQRSQEVIEKWKHIANTNEMSLMNAYQHLDDYERWIYSQVSRDKEIICDAQNCLWKDSGGYSGGDPDGMAYCWFLDNDVNICDFCFNNQLGKIEKKLEKRLINLISQKIE